MPALLTKPKVESSSARASGDGGKASNRDGSSEQPASRRRRADTDGHAVAVEADEAAEDGGQRPATGGTGGKGEGRQRAEDPIEKKKGQIHKMGPGM